MTIASGMPSRSSDSLLERGDVEIADVVEQMQVEIDQRRGGVFDRRKALVEGARREQPLQQRLRHRLAGLGSGRAKRRSTSGCSSQCSKSCEGNSTKSVATLVPEISG